MVIQYSYWLDFTHTQQHPEHMSYEQCRGQHHKENWGLFDQEKCQWTLRSKSNSTIGTDSH